MDGWFSVQLKIWWGLIGRHYYRVTLLWVTEPLAVFHPNRTLRRFWKPRDSVYCRTCDGVNLKEGFTHPVAQKMTGKRVKENDSSDKQETTTVGCFGKDRLILILPQIITFIKTSTFTKVSRREYLAIYFNHKQNSFAPCSVFFIFTIKSMKALKVFRSKVIWQRQLAMSRYQLLFYAIIVNIIVINTIFISIHIIMDKLTIIISITEVLIINN